MTEVPEHLLQRSRERRAALGLGGDAGDAAPAATPATTAAAATPAATDTEAAETPIIVEEPPPPKVVTPPARVPVWAVPVLVVLPFWAFLYVGAFGDRGSAEAEIMPGKPIYDANCASCHGAAGQGGTGPTLSGVTATFPEFQAHFDWVVNGSLPVAGQTYGEGTRVASGGMPAFGQSLSEQEIVDVVCYERVEFGGAELPPECGEVAAEGGEPAESAEG